PKDPDRGLLARVKYFTARVRPSPSDQNVNVRQDTYLRALWAHCALLELYYGHFLRHRQGSRCARTEEKGSDVNLALHVL
ncbi:hypothetical protein B1B_09693, partial [mine drainage metagenome]